MPDLLTNEAGSKVTSARDWEKKRRPEVLGIFEQMVYGKVPEGDFKQSSKLIRKESGALNGKADAVEVEITIEKNDRTLSFVMLVFLVLLRALRTKSMFA